MSPDTLRSQLRTLKARLDPYGLADAVALCDESGNPVRDLGKDHLDLDAAVECDLLINLRYAMPASVAARFRRSVPFKNRLRSSAA